MNEELTNEQEKHSSDGFGDFDDFVEAPLPQVELVAKPSVENELHLESVDDDA